jgi:myo-inositol 2-dehydrogenase/D-chiro-inositol 1-dehydrogenase
MLIRPKTLSNATLTQGAKTPFVHFTMTDQPTTTRRQFLKTSALAGGALLAPTILPARSSAAEDGPTLKVGLIGCGGRGTGAAGEALAADKNVALTAMADVFAEKLEASLDILRQQAPDKVKVEPDHCFVGLDAYQKLIDSGVDVVLLATPPGFRPVHLKAAVAAGKHIFCEKPVATDAPGVRSVLETVEEARRKNLALVAGFCWRYNLAERALYEQIHSGAIGEVRAIYATYYTGEVRPIPPASERQAGMSDLEWQLRHWYNFGWLSGDGLVEQAVHAVDWMLWALKDQPPEKSVAVGGRQIPAEGGNIYDHFEVNYEFAGGVRGFVGCRQQGGCANDNTATMFGTKGDARELGFAGLPFIRGENPWRYQGERPNMYQIEHNELFASIRSGKPINDGVRLAHTTLAAIMGRMAAYTGQEITWDMALNSQESLVPAKPRWKTPVPVPSWAMPGRTKFI